MNTVDDMNEEPIYHPPDDESWLCEDMIEISLKESDDFLKVKETLTRIGIASNKQKKLYQSCHILHKRGRYFIAHFKAMFRLDNMYSDFDENDKARLNTIAALLHEWELVSVLEPDDIKSPREPVGRIKIIPHREKHLWELVPKYVIGNKNE